MKRLLPVVVFLVALSALTAFAVLTVNRGPFERSPAASELFFWEAARRDAGGELDAAWREISSSPLYLRVLAPLASDEVGAVRRARRTLTAVLVPLLAILVFALAWRRAGAWPAVLAGAGAAVAGPLVLGAGTLAPGAVATALGLVALLMVDGRPRALGWLLGGVFTGLAACFVPPLGWALGLLLAGGALFAPRPPRARALAAVLFTAGWLGAAALGGTAAGTGPAPPTISGIDMYRGHRAEASGVIPRRGDHDEAAWWTTADYVREAGRIEGRPLTHAQAERYWAGRTLSSSLEAPASKLQRTVTKTLAGFQGDPLARDVSAAFLMERGEGNGLAAVVWAGRILIPLGLAGLLLARRRAGWPVVAGALSGYLAALVTYAQADARGVTVAALLVGVALGADLLYRGPARARVGLLAAGVAAVALFGFWAAFGGVPGQAVAGDDHAQLGSVYDVDGRGSTAMREYERALRLDPSNPYSRFALARMLARDNVATEAIHELEALRERQPRFLPGLAALARLYEQQQRWRDAAAVYGQLCELDPFQVEYWNNLGTMHVQIGYYEQAARAFEQALAVDPGYETARANLEGMRQRGLAPGRAEPEDPYLAAQERIVTALRRGDLPAAEAALASAYETYGRDDPGLVYLEGTLRITTGEMERAVKLLESVRGAMTGNIVYLNNLAAAYAGTGQLDEAIGVWEEALALQPANERMRMSLEQARSERDSLADGRD